MLGGNIICLKDLKESSHEEGFGQRNGVGLSLLCGGRTPGARAEERGARPRASPGGWHWVPVGMAAPREELARPAAASKEISEN